MSLRPKVPKLAALMDEAEADMLAFMSFPKDHRPKIHSLNPLERLNGEISGVPTSSDSQRRCHHATRRRHCCLNRTMNGRFSAAGTMSLETIAPLSDDPTVKLPAVAA